VCPHGTLFVFSKFQVTLPNNASIIEKISAVYGLVPFFVIFVTMLDVAIRAAHRRAIGSRELCFLGFVVLIVLLNEGIFKQLAAQPRPEGSCVNSCGFPSGHSTMAMGFFMLMFTDAVFRTVPKLPMTLGSARYERRHRMRSASDDVQGTLDRRWWSVIPLSVSDVLGSFDLFSFAITWGLLLLPVPLSRVVLKDHSPEQAFVGCLIGAIEGVLWWALMRYLVQEPCNHLLGAKLWGFCIHNYALPRFVVQSKCCRLLAKVEEAFERESKELAAEGHSSSDSSMTCIDWIRLGNELEKIHREIGWYLGSKGRWQNMTARAEDLVFDSLEASSLWPLQQRVEAELVRMGRPLPSDWTYSEQIATAAGPSPCHSILRDSNTALSDSWVGRPSRSGRMLSPKPAVEEGIELPAMSG